MAKKKFYAVRNGRKPGIYENWSDCEEQVKGFKNAEYKSFNTIEEADRYMVSSSIDEADDGPLSESEDINIQIEKCIDKLVDSEVVAFVDGSYNASEQKAGYGVIIISNDRTKEILYRAITEKLDKDFTELWNVAPEMEAAKQAINWAIKNNKSKITIFYDYEGIEKWATGEWKARKALTKKYVSFINDKKRLIDIEFFKVPAHSGVTLNEEVDQLAKRAVLEKGYRNYDNGSVYFEGLSVDDWKAVAELLNEENGELEKRADDITVSFELIEYRTKIVLQQGNNKVTINCYRYDKSYVQGKHSALFQRVLSTAISLLESGEQVVETYNKYHAIDINREDVEIQFDSYLPNYNEDRKGKHYANLMSAVYNTMLTGYRPDYTHLITPIFRSYEYYLHRVLGDVMGLTTTKPDGSSQFGFFQKNPTGFYECSSSQKSVLSTKQLDYLNDLYTNYNKVRHPYSHWAYEDEDCAVITEITEARNLLEQGLSLFDTYYLLF